MLDSVKYDSAWFRDDFNRLLTKSNIQTTFATQSYTPVNSQKNQWTEINWPHYSKNGFLGCFVKNINPHFLHWTQLNISISSACSFVSPIQLKWNQFWHMSHLTYSRLGFRGLRQMQYCSHSSKLGVKVDLITSNEARVKKVVDRSVRLN